MSASPLTSADTTRSVNFEALLQKLDGEFSALQPSMIERFSFQLEGLSFEVRRIVHDEVYRFLITANLGYLPFSIESTERRVAIRTIILATRSLPTVHFTIDRASKITAGGLFEVPRAASLDSVFYPLSLFLQEARPFIDLIGQYLFKAPTL